MKLAASYSSHGGDDAWHARDAFEWLTDIFDAPSVHVGPKSGSTIRKHVEGILASRGWAIDCRIATNFDLTVTAKSGDLAFQIQTGNISRAAYDLLKLQHLYLSQSIAAAALALPTKAAAARIGSNIANSDRVWDELQLFSRQISVPLLLIAFE